MNTFWVTNLFQVLCWLWGAQKLITQSDSLLELESISPLSPRTPPDRGLHKTPESTGEGYVPWNECFYEVTFELIITDNKLMG